MGRHINLVSQYLEDLPYNALVKHQDVIRHYIRRRNGVYALYRKGKLVYVGLATNLRSRLKHHLKDHLKQKWDRFSVYLTIGDSHLRELESLLLRIAQPKANKQKGRFSRHCEDLRRRLRRDITEKQRRELRMLLGLHGCEPEPAKDDGPRTRRPALYGYFDHAIPLRARYKGKTWKAKVRRDGTIRFGKKVYRSPSLAATAVVGRNCNGWRFWTYERAPGDWVRLRELRKR